MLTLQVMNLAMQGNELNCWRPALSECSCYYYFRLCINALGCSSIGYRQTDGMMGNCAVIAPTDTALHLNDIPDADHPDWNYITVE